MTGIAVGLTNIPKIAIGTTEILKVSLGEVLVWPSAPVGAVYFAVNNITFGADKQWLITVPDGASRMGICVAGMGGNGFTTGYGAGGGGGGLVWANVDVIAGQVVTIDYDEVQKYISARIGNDALATCYTGGEPTGANFNAGGSGGVAYAYDLPARNSTQSASAGGTGGSCSTTGRSAGGGSAGGYANAVNGLNGADGAITNQAGVAGINGSGASGNGVSSGSSNGQGGGTGVFGQGTNGVAPSGEGSTPTSPYNAYIGGGGGRGRNASTLGQGGAFAVRFFANDYPEYVQPVTLTVPAPV